MEVDAASAAEREGIVVVAPKRVDTPQRQARGAELKMGRKDQCAADSLAMVMDRVCAAKVKTVLVNRSDAAISEGIARLLASRGKLARMRGRLHIEGLHDRGTNVQCTIYISNELEFKVARDVCNALNHSSA